MTIRPVIEVKYDDFSCSCEGCGKDLLHGSNKITLLGKHIFYLCDDHLAMWLFFIFLQKYIMYYICRNDMQQKYKK